MARPATLLGLQIPTLPIPQLSQASPPESSPLVPEAITPALFCKGLLDSGAVMCWGRCQEAQIGDNSAPCPASVYTKTLPNLVFGLAAGSGVIKISAGNGHTCAVMSNGSAVCWGGAAPSCLCSSILSSSCRRQPIWADGRRHSGFYNNLPQACSWFCSGVTDAVAITCGSCHTCVLRSTGQPMCWGCNTQG